MDDVRAGLVLRSLRRRARLRQSDLASQVGTSQQSISRIERGDFDQMAIRTIRTVFARVGAEYRGEVRWRGSEVDRLLDDAHATLVGAVATMLRTSNWRVAIEATFSRYGERGSIDILAWHGTEKALLVIEVKSSMVSVEELLRRLDIKVRLAPGVAADLWSVRIARASRLVILPATRTERRRVKGHRSVLAPALPVQGRQALEWLRAPRGILHGLAFVSSTHAGNTCHGRGGRHRVDVPRRG